MPVRGEAASYAEQRDVRRALGQVAPARRAAVIQHHVLGIELQGNRRPRRHRGDGGQAAIEPRHGAIARAAEGTAAPNDASFPLNCDRGFTPTTRRCGRCRRRGCGRYGARRSPCSRCWPRRRISTCAPTPRNSAGSAAGVPRWCRSAVGFALLAAALRESVPGRSWRARCDRDVDRRADRARDRGDACQLGSQPRGPAARMVDGVGAVSQRIGGDRVAGGGAGERAGGARLSDAAGAWRGYCSASAPA